MMASFPSTVPVRSRSDSQVEQSISHTHLPMYSYPSSLPLYSNTECDGSENGKAIDYVVLKFGGTSVAKCLSTIVDTIVPSVHVPNQHVPILVCSAQSYTIKTEGTTQCLLSAIDAALDMSELDDIPPVPTKLKSAFKGVLPLTPPPTPFEHGSPTINAMDHLPPVVEEPLNPKATPRRIVEEILERHLEGARRVLNPISVSKDDEALASLEQDLRGDCERVLKILQAVSTFGEISSRVRDTVISVGELMACRSVVAALRSRNISARLVDLTNLDRGAKRFDSGYSSTPLDNKFYDELVLKLKEHIHAASIVNLGETSPVLVATGFFGPIPGSLLNQIGRGYTDVCAALCARAVGAVELQIWKEVDGVFSADPRKILGAQLLPEISSDQAKLLTSYGSEVVHHLAIDQTLNLDIPIVVKNVMNPSASGTRIVATLPPTSGSPTDFLARTPFAVTLLNDLEMVHVHFRDSVSGHPMLCVMDILRQNLRDTSLGLDLVNSAQGSVCFMVKGASSRSAECNGRWRKAMVALERVASVTTSSGLSYLQVILGSPPHLNPAIAWKMFGALADAHIGIKTISHGPVEYGIGCVVREKEALRAASVVHDALLQMLW